MPVYLLDTCAVIWIANGDPLHEPAESALREAYATGGGLAVSPMAAWEIAMLAAKGKIALSIAPEVWFDRVLALPGVALGELPPCGADRIMRSSRCAARRSGGPHPRRDGASSWIHVGDP